MAVIPSIPGLSVTVEVEGKAACEFRHPFPERDNSTIIEREDFDLPSDYEGPLPHLVRYIEGTPGEEFEVVVVKEASFPRKSHHLGYILSIDGKDTGRDQQYPGNPAERWTSRLSGFISGNPTNGYKEHKFQFKDLRSSKPLRSADRILTY